MSRVIRKTGNDNDCQQYRDGTQTFCSYTYIGTPRDVIDSRQIDKSTFSLCQLNRIKWLGIELK